MVPNQPIPATLPNQPIPAPYSSFHSNEGLFDYRVRFNYDLSYELVEFDLANMGDIYTKNFLCLMGGNYRPEAFSKVEAGQRHTKPKCWKISEILRNFSMKCFVLNNYLQDRERLTFFAEQNGQDSVAAAMYADMQHLLREIPHGIEHVLTPMLTKVNQANFEMYGPYSFDSFKTRLLSLRGFDGFSRCFMMDFFFFSCYALPSERVQIIELAIKRGRELDLNMRRGGRQLWQASVCFWTAIEYYDLAKSGPYNAKFVNGRVDGRSSPTSLMARFKDRMRSLRAREPRAAYALQFIEENCNSSTLPRARLCDLLVHIDPLFSFVNECGVAFASCLLTVTRPARDGDELAPIAGLGEDLIRTIWSYAVDELGAKTHPVERNSARGARELWQLRAPSLAQPSGACKRRALRVGARAAPS